MEGMSGRKCNDRMINVLLGLLGTHLHPKTPSNNINKMLREGRGRDISEWCVTGCIGQQRVYGEDWQGEKVTQTHGRKPRGVGGRMVM